MNELAIITLISIGANVTIDARRYNIITLTSMAQATKIKNARLIIKYASKLSIANIQAIASVNPERISFDFTD